MLYLASIFIIIFGLKFLSPILIYLILSIFLSFLLIPIFKFFENKGLPSIISYTLTISSFLLIFLIISILIKTSLDEFIKNYPIYESKLHNLIIQYKDSLEKINFNFQDINIIPFIQKFLGKAGSIVSGFIIVVIGVSFLLFESNIFHQKINLLSNNPKIFIEFYKSVQKYFVIKFFTSLLTGICVGIMVYSFKIDYAFLLGFLAFILNFIPVVGSIIAAIPGIFLALINYGIESAIYVSIFYVIINISISNILEPKIMGNGLNLSPAVIFFSLIFWGYIFGIVGTFFAVPLTLSLKLALQYSNKTQKWAKLLS
ncbi:AI-2E family transporter [Caminibacter mediatlanticus TB-2]|uniref:AI-2E family transporter n=1 Tax=Caminibacter mediatlanticus TB-2 TaxID=391592 RepID=A0AAI9AI51_9BACT|nr:AI-2E family transporter [Caminibacter mediatlanticus]EDM24098.1 predicted permease [Caminibacter mediatlanticus TB-2]QCT94460.1 AI-2E family transporter [Caminibacter mediatlanticus TB-2]